MQRRTRIIKRETTQEREIRINKITRRKQGEKIDNKKRNNDKGERELRTKIINRKKQIEKKDLYTGRENKVRISCSENNRRDVLGKKAMRPNPITLLPLKSLNY